MDPNLSDLDDMLAEMDTDKAAETTTEMANQAHALATALIDGVDRDANVDRGTVPQGAAPTPVVVLDSVQYPTFGPQHLNVEITDSIDAGIVELIIRCGGRDFSTAGLRTHVSRIKSVYRLSPVPVVTTDHENAIARQLTACEPSLPELRTVAGDQTLDIPLPQAAAVISFLKTYPQVWGKLGEAKVPVKFNSSKSASRGGGLFENNTIYMSKLLVTPAGAFVRLFVHEIGHALFETTLLNNKTMPHELVADKLTDLKRDAQTAPRDCIKKCQKIQSFWDNMSDPAKTFYRAWRTLRQSGGKHLLGIDLWVDPQGNRLSPAQRLPYQAKNFGEFCAEVFMLYAMGDLQAHVVAVLNNGDINQNVKTAWKNSWHILETVAAPTLGPRS
jgi:hypothetical protein